MDEHLMTEEEFLRQAKAWADAVRRQAKANAAGFTKGKTMPHTYIKGRYAGKTEKKLKDSVNYTLKKSYGDLAAVSFKMPVHGIFREYGVGNGQPINGMAAKSGKSASRHVYIKRSMSVWIHNPIDRNFENLADLVADYYGDKVLLNFQRLTANDVSHQGLV